MKDCNDELNLKKLRKQIVLTATKGGIGHLASSFSCLEILYVLYLRGIMKHDPAHPDMPTRDRLVLSKGHAGLALYTVMSEAGYLSKEKLNNYLQEGSSIGGEPSIRDLPGIEASTGSLGHGLPVATGMALAQKLDQTGARTFVILGDGECQEGSIWEAAISAVALELGNLVAILDANSIQKMCTIEETMRCVNWRAKFESFGWTVCEIDGHDVDQLIAVLSKENDTNKPMLIMAHTIKGKGVSIMENNPLWHFKLPNKKEKKAFMSELEITEAEYEVN